MAKVGIIVISYRSDPLPLFTSVSASHHEIFWYIFVHGQDKILRLTLDSFAARTNSHYFPYGINRGVARSWNDGLIASFGDANDVTIILNDDLFFYADGFDRFVEFVLSEAQRVRDFGLITVYGREPGAVRNNGAGESDHVIRPEDAACMAVGPAAIKGIGFFDENFWPAYWEDVDYFYRLGLAQLPILCDERVLVAHRRSASLRNDPVASLLNQERWLRNQRYYMRKWGGDFREEAFTSPFNDKRLEFFIAAQQRAAPFAGQYDRTDLASSATLGFLDDNFTEELLSVLHRHGNGIRRYLEWGGESTVMMAEYAKSKGVEFFLSIDHRRERLRRAAAALPKYPFLHFRVIEAEERQSDDGPTDAGVDYISYPIALGMQFDVVFVAGRWRMECALLAATVLAPEGLLILHDEGRTRRQAMRPLLAGQEADARPGLDQVLDAWEQSRKRTLRELYEVIETRGRFLVLRLKAPPANGAASVGR